jgi:hypothetical protein
MSLAIYAGLPVLYFLSITVLRGSRQRNQEFADFTWPDGAHSDPASRRRTVRVALRRGRGAGLPADTASRESEVARTGQHSECYDQHMA